MKRIQFSIRKTVVAVLMGGFALTAAVPALAKDKKQTAPAVLNIEPAIQFTGSDDASSTFHIRFENEKAVKFELSIRDINGELLFTQEFEASKFSKFVKFVHNDGEDVAALFTFRDLATGAEQTYEASSTVKTVKNVVVTKL